MSSLFYRGLLSPAGGGGGGGGGGGCGVVLATAWDDNFDCGSSVDTAGTRFSGANAWTIFNSGSGIPVPPTFVQSGGILTADPGSYTTAMSPRGYSQAFPVGNSTFVLKCKPLSIPPGWGGVGLLLAESATGKALALTLCQNGSVMQSEVRIMTAFNAGWSSNISGTAAGGAAGVDHWVEVGRSGTNLTFRASMNGSSWTNVCTAVAQTTYFTTAPDLVAFFVNQVSVGSPFVAEIDSFARTS